MKPKIVVIITRSQIGGAQKYVLSMVTKLKNKFAFSVIIGSEGYLSRALECENIDVFIIPQIDSPNILVAPYKISMLLKQLSPDLVNTHSTLASIYTRIASIKLNIPLVYSVHGWFFLNNTTWARRTFGPLIERLLSGLTDYWITETQFDRRVGLEHKVITNAEKSCVVPNGIIKSSQRFDKNLDQKKRNIVFIGRISHQKNPELAIKILNHLPAHYVLTVYCDNALDLELQKLVRTLELNDRVKFIDDENDTSSVIHNYELLLVTSRYEGMPLSIIEAMAVGLPIVCANVCGLNELVIDGENGYLVSNDSPKEYAQKVLEIFEDSMKLERMGACSNSIYRNNHTIEAMVSQLSDIFKQQISAKCLEKP